MLDKTTVIRVSNRDNGSVGYSVPEMGIKRVFQKGEEKEVTMEELRKLSYIPGGQVIINECLIVHNEDALKELNPNYEPEYFYTEKEIKELLLHGTQAQFLDCLDFAPEGVIGLIKQMAVELEINDLAKRNAILEKTGFNVTRAIEINHESKETDETPEVKQRRTSTPVIKKEESETPARRTSAPATGKYSVKK